MEGIGFAAPLLLSAILLFWVEPMFAKMVLPLLGGTPAVWNTCMVFFQTGLLAGYAFAHSTTQRLGVRRQSALHVFVLFGAVLVLPVHIVFFRNWPPPSGHNPIPWLLMILLVSVGLPFFVLSTVSPTLQTWYANTANSGRSDPYFLYSASNLGSILGLLSYPVLIEPYFPLAEQSRLWTAGYLSLIALDVVCALRLWRSHAPDHYPSPFLNSAEFAAGVEPVPAPGLWQRLRWVALAFVPSSLMLGVTTSFTTDFPPIPLFWVVPLAVYLLTFILVFAKKPFVSPELMNERLPFLILAALFPVISKTEWPVWLVIALDLLALFAVSAMSHGGLAQTRPPSTHLTEFYLWISLGGVLGGVFNALIAPLVFKRVLEYPLALILAALLRLPPGSRTKQTKYVRLLDYGMPLVLAGMIAALLRSARAFGLQPGEGLQLLVFAPALVLCLSFGKRPLRFALGTIALFVSSSFYDGPYGKPLYADRSFFGVSRVTTDASKKFHLLFHGSTLHGMQSLDARRGREPLTYYSRTGPIGDVFAALEGSSRLQRVAIVGLGAGSLASYGKPGQELTFYEIDPTVERIARRSQYFTFLRDSPAKVGVVLGDARLSLVHAPDRGYGLIILDAFSSDTVPVHLLTREAIRLYFSKLADGGVLAFHISNRYLDLRPVLGDLAADANAFCLLGNDSNISPAEENDGKRASLWVVMTRQEKDLGGLVRGSRWTVLSAEPRKPPWSDDFSNIVSVIRWWN